MKKFFYEVFFENTSFFVKLLGVLFIIVLVVVALCLMYQAYIFIDQSSSKIYQNKGIVYYGEFVPEHNEMIVAGTGKGVAPISVHYDDAWYLDVSISDGCARASVSKELYNSTNINDSVIIQYTQGVFTKSNIYIKYVEKLKK